MNVHKSDDLEAVAKIMNHPRVYRMIADDLTPDTIIPEGAFYIMNDKKTGVIKVEPINGISCSVHISTLPSLWGRADEFVLSAIGWGFKNTLFTKIIAMIPEYNRLATCMCLKCGFDIEGILHKSVQKNWKYYDMTILGLTKVKFLTEMG